MGGLGDGSEVEVVEDGDVDRLEDGVGGPLDREEVKLLDEVRAELVEEVVAAVPNVVEVVRLGCPRVGWLGDREALDDSDEEGLGGA